MPDTAVEGALETFRSRGLAVRELRADPAAFRGFVACAGYDQRWPDYYKPNRIEKAFEHWVALQLLAPGRSDVFVDVASERSPLPDIVARLHGTTAYRQDLAYPEGLHGVTIGGDACRMPVADGFASSASLTCSFEHFEGDSDAGLFRELGRVLKPGGRVCIVPLYMSARHANQTDPEVSAGSDVRFDAGARLYLARGWRNRFGRFYSAESLVDRVVTPSLGAFQFEVVHLANASAVDPGIYARLALLATRLEA
jgi:SAM-dependent methyltransferase